MDDLDDFSYEDAEELVEQAADEFPAAGDLLSVCAFLSHEHPIPAALLDAGAARLPERLSAALADEVDRSDLFRLIREFGLGKADGETLRIENEALDYAFNRLGAREAVRWTQIAASTVAAAFPGEPEKPEPAKAAAALEPHALAAAEHCLAFDTALDVAAQLLSLAGRLAIGLGRHERARESLERALALRERVHGDTDERVALDLSYLNAALLPLGESAAARVAENAGRAARIFEAIQGPLGRTTIVHLNNHGTLLRRAGRLDEARAVLEDALERAQRSYGERHAFVATITSNLGDVLKEMGALAGARRCYEHALAVDEHAYAGQLNRSLARDTHKLAKLLARLGERDAARPLFQRTIDFYAGQLGADHPDVQALRAEMEAG